MHKKRTVQTDTVIGRLLYCVIAFTLFFTLLNFGGVTQIAMIRVMLASLICGFFTVCFIRNKKSLMLRQGSFAVPLFFFVAYCMFRTFFSFRYSESIFIALSFLAYALFFVACITILSRERAIAIIRFIAVLSVCTAVYGLVAYFFHANTFLGVAKHFYAGRVTSFFYNPNHCAAFLTLSLPLVVYCGTREEKKWTSLIWYSAAVCVLSALVATFSVGGMLACAGGFIGALCFKRLFASGNACTSRVRAVLYLIIAVCCMLVILSWLPHLLVYMKTVGWGKSYSFYSRYYLAEGIVSLLWTTALTSPMQCVWGVGLQGFSYVYQLFHPVLTLQYYLFAHNDYLQLLIELGCAGFILFVWGLVRIIKLSLSDFVFVATRTCNGVFFLTWAVWSFLIHLCFDFNLFIPVNCLTLFILVALLETHTDTRKKAVRVTRPVLVGAGILLLSCACFVGIMAVGQYTLNQAYTHTVKRDFVKSEKLFKRAMRLPIWRSCADVSSAYAEMLFLQARTLRDKEDAHTLADQAMVYFDKACKLNPLNVQYRVRLATLYAFTGNYEHASELFQRSIAMMPQSAVMRLIALDFYTQKPDVYGNAIVSEIRYLLDNVHATMFQDASEKKRYARELASYLSVVSGSDADVLRLRVENLLEKN